MIYAQEHQIYDAVEAGLDDADVHEMIADYLRGQAYREYAEGFQEQGGEEDQLLKFKPPVIEAADIAKWLSDHYAELRRREYKGWREQLEMLYEDADVWRSSIASVRARHPKTVVEADIKLNILATK